MKFLLPFLGVLLMLRLPSDGARAASPAWPPGCVATAALVRLGAPRLMADFTTTYPTSDPDRDANLKLAAKRLCGTVVAPGGSFSFNGTVGEASVRNGFRRAHVFIGDRIVSGDGGGVCQVVGTLYNGVVRAGLPVTERHLHGLTVPYVPPGEDATIAYGTLDFRFENDTPGPVVLVADAKGPSVRVALYGTVAGVEAHFHHRRGSEVPPYTLRIPSKDLPQGAVRVREAGQPGLTVSTWLTQSGRGGRRTTYLGSHTYRASPRIIEVGTGESRRPAGSRASG